MKTCAVRARPCAFLLAFLSPFLVSAQSTASTTLGEVVVTATRSETRADELISDVTVISRDEIEKAGGRTLSELISRAAGIQTSSNGGLGKSSNLYVRGTESRHVLLLVDGVRYGSSTTGAANFDTIPAELIDHIEVLKGPASALYGSDAVGGVIQVFTRKGVQGLHPYASLTAGEYNHGEGTAGLSGGTAEFSYALGLQTVSERGFSASNARAASTTYNPDPDGINQSTGNFSFAWKPVEGWALRGSALQSDGTYQYDSGKGTYDTHANFSTGVTSLALEGTILSGWKSTLSTGSGSDKTQYYTSITPTRFNTRQDQVTWQNNVKTPWGEVLLGLDSLNENVDSTTAYKITSRTTDSQFAGLSGAAGAHTWQVNARHDQNSQFGDADTWYAGYGYALTPSLQVKGSTGTTFKAPSFNSLYFPGFGNATTQPEKGRSSELGLVYTMDHHQFNLTYFTNRIQGFITLAPVVANIPYAKIEGWTLSHQGDAGNYRFHTALDALDARNEVTGMKLPRRADLLLTTGVDYVAGAWSMGADVLASSDTYDDVANKQSLGGYATLDLHVAYAIDKDWSVDGKLVNAGDKFYQTAYGYNQSGRAAYVTLRYQPR